MPKYPWKSYSPLRTHEFDDGVSTQGPEPGVLFICRSCSRRFKFDSIARRTWAVGEGRSYLALQDAVSRRWVSESCSGEPNEDDAEDSKQVKLRVVERPSRAGRVSARPSS